jgi:hypothetical protein
LLFTSLLYICETLVNLQSICHEEDSTDAKISGSRGGIWTTADGRCDGGGNKSIEKMPTDRKKEHSPPTITKATPTTDKRSVEYNTINIIAKCSSSRTRPRTNLKRDSKFALNPERPHFES